MKGCVCKKKVLMLASVASMIDQFNMPNIRLMLEMGYEVHVACNFREGNTCDDKRVEKLKKTLQDLGVIWHMWDCPRSAAALNQCCRAFGQLWKLTGRFSFAWMHCQSPVGGALARMAAHFRKIRVVYTAHGFHFYQGAPWKNWMLYYPVEKCLSYWTDVLVTVNREDERLAKARFGAGAVWRIPGVGIDLKAYRKQETGYGPDQMAGEIRSDFRKKYGIPEHAKILLSVGELSRRKNHQVVLDALAGFLGKDVYYLICGQGAEREELQKKARALGIVKYVKMAGFQEDLVLFYQNADIFVFPSLQEGLPVALMEAMAAGLPCVVSDIRGNRELIRNRRMRFAPDEPWQPWYIVAGLLADGEYRAACGAENRKNSNAYGSNVVRKKMEKIYQEMARNENSGKPKMEK